MFTTLITFLPVAILLTITPGVATVLVIRTAARDGRRAALATTAGNSLGVLTWALAAAVGIATVIAASAVAFTIVKLCGAVVLVWMGVRALLAHRAGKDAELPARGRQRSAFAAGLLTSITNPKLAVFFVALFPHFLPDDAAVLPAVLAMALLIVALDLVWYSLLAALVARARDAFVRGGWLKRAERACGAVLVGLGVRLALEQR